ncbi:uncharacterized protein LOC120014258 [Tripterygium wilfordii]|uniref:uncharacterized protein LOC120014255 n=1 Tax=Tripterygium wilfordii TaxID=458696 RepID=UPI0018F84910|nr:uncharacterized protein LOC120014255 [Tripterygium wilfordii]XP_038722101.1 uncharacterized protein LOC120014258 [Tripterygium wilfordii]
MESQFLERVLDGCGNDLDPVIESLLALSLEEKLGGFAAESDTSSEKEKLSSCGDLAGWADFLVRELQSATSIDDARARASSLLQMHEESIRRQEAAQIEVMIGENAILKRAIAVQLRRQKEFAEDRNREVRDSKKLLSQYQEQLRTLELCVRIHIVVYILYVRYDENVKNHIVFVPSIPNAEIDPHDPCAVVTLHVMK